MVCLSWIQDNSETLSLYFYFSSTSVQTPDHKKKNIQGAIELTSFFPKANISFITGLLEGRDNT